MKITVLRESQIPVCQIKDSELLPRLDFYIQSGQFVYVCVCNKYTGIKTGRNTYYKIKKTGQNTINHIEKRGKRDIIKKGGSIYV